MSQQLACTDINMVGYRMMITLFVTPWRATHRREVRQLTVIEGGKKRQSLMTGTDAMLAIYS